MLRTPITATLVAALAIPSLGFAQGDDLCSRAQNISGIGIFPFDNSAATTSAPAGCSMARDVWFRWVAPATRSVTVSTCGLTTTPGLDTALAVHPAGSCPPSAALVCEDDSCRLDAEVTFQATAGEAYLLRVGTWASASYGGTGFIEISLGGSVGGCSAPSAGADVVAGDLDEAIAYGALGGTSAYSFATTACNVGDEELLWVAQSSDHPVVAHGLYRFEGGRLEQLGTGWAKHGFAAIQRELCCDCIPSGSMSALGVGCSDPYSGYLNGTQSTLGPRVEVDAFTGAIAWPIGSSSNVQPASSLLDRRVQVPTEALDPVHHPTAIYLAEAVYAAPDDAAAGNHFDNASHRPYERTGAMVWGAHQIEPTGVTERGLPAIASWARLSATALVREVRVPGEGALWVGSDAIPLGAGVWRYELCVFNLNSSRGVAGLALPGGAAPRQLGMSYPRAHSGEPRRNDSWPGGIAGDRVGWTAPGAAGDTEANTIGWGTAFSFWFTSDSPPSDGVGELTLHRGAGPARLPVPLRVPLATGAPVAEVVCDAVVNSTGLPGVMLPGTFDGSTSQLELRAIGLPPGAIGMALVSAAQASVPMAGGSVGTLCLGGTIGRSVGATTSGVDAAGELDVIADLAALPQGLSTVGVRPGDTWFFQVWHRDVQATSNFTQALAVHF
ncbi:MAG: hypothetical protein VX460_02155 [Planctomycetota bacterium]|nr:hypothetical protein [Planctomycetota bacterium]